MVYCDQCGAIYGVVPVVIKSPPLEGQKHPSSEQPTPKEPPVPTNNPLDEIGHADLSQKIPYDPKKMAARFRATGSKGTLYRQIAIDDGPPYCLTCRVEMVKMTIPPPYPNEGAVIWICPNFEDCKQWELADETA